MSQLTRRAALHHLAAFALGSTLLPGSLAAHPLPGAVITLAVDDTRLSLTVSVPYADLALAMGNPRPQAPEAGPMPPDLHRAFATYFADHMSVATEGQPDLDLRLTRVRMERATHEHIGAYNLLVADFSAPVPTGSAVFPLTLTYDAVMHEVRNQSASVFLQSPGQDPVAVGLIRLDPNLGTAAPLVIAAP